MRPSEGATPAGEGVPVFTLGDQPRARRGERVRSLESCDGAVRLAELEATLAELIRTAATGSYVRVANRLRFVGHFEVAR